LNAQALEILVYPEDDGLVDIHVAVVIGAQYVVDRLKIE
jgi:hypothetical protein